MENKKIAIIIGAGPAGLTAAYELLKKTDIKPVILESTGELGGIARTINYKGNRIDIGGHRFFSKSDRVMKWWQNILPLQAAPSGGKTAVTISYQNKNRQVNLPANGPNPETEDKVMLVRSRLSRIFYLRKFFDYPVSLNLRTIGNLGFMRLVKIGFSYLKALLFPVEEKSLEDFFINRFGRELYLTFFKDYTEKVWGVPCNEIEPEWGAQRIKGLSITKALLHMVSEIFRSQKDIEQKNIETSLIQQFLYPKFGPGQMWEEVAKQITALGGEIHFHSPVTILNCEGKNITSVLAKNEKTGETKSFTGDYFFSTMPVKDLVLGLRPGAPAKLSEIAKNLKYRDFITVGLLLTGLKVHDKGHSTNLIADNWIYIQELDVKVGRLQIFNNWSPYMVLDKKLVWIGLEYFCNEGDELWNMEEQAFKHFAIAELAKINIIDPKDVLDGVVIKMPKAYPAYFGSYGQFSEIKDYTDGFANLFLVGRNGMHKYNNQDHSMLTAMLAVENIINGVTSKNNLWQVNTEEEYHESK